MNDFLSFTLSNIHPLQYRALFIDYQPIVLIIKTMFNIHSRLILEIKISCSVHATSGCRQTSTLCMVLLCCYDLAKQELFLCAGGQQRSVWEVAFFAARGHYWVISIF